MRAHRVTITRILLVVAAAALGSLGFASGATAGGWANTTLDAVPTPVPGEPTDVGFTIRQHGETPVDVLGDVALVVRDSDGATTVFPAAGDGPVGHYVATIVVPSAGSYTWVVRQGQFGEQSLGMFVTSEGGDANRAGAGGWQAPDPLVPALVLVALVMAGLAVADLVRGRKRPVVAGAEVARGPAPRAT
jgi:hypothetical protein